MERHDKGMAGKGKPMTSQAQQAKSGRKGQQGGSGRRTHQQQQHEGMGAQHGGKIAERPSTMRGSSRTTPADE